MGRGKSEFSPAENAFIVARYLEGPLATMSGTSRMPQANLARQKAWEQLRDEFVDNFLPSGSKRIVTVQQLMKRWKHSYSDARKKFQKPQVIFEYYES